jgi:hypothetical protein
VGRFRNQDKFDTEIAAAHRYVPAVPVVVIKAVIATESAFDPGAYLAEVGDTGSTGLMQVLPSTARNLGFRGTTEQLFVPSINILYGTKLLNQLSTRLGASDWERVYSAYNGGIRPLLGFGTRVAKPTTVCLRRDPDTGRCVNTFTAQVGEFGNQPNVDRFARQLAYFEGRTVGGVANVFPFLLLALGGLYAAYGGKTK